MPDINALPVVSGARRPRGAIKLNGAIVAGWESWEVENNAFRAADTFSATFAIGGLPSGYGPDWFAKQATITCEIFATADAPDPGNYQPSAGDRVIYGQVDDIEFAAVAGKITISGRDLTSVFIDNKTTESHLNQTSSQIATLLAGNHGLTPVVTATTAKVGTLYSQNFVNLTQERTEWDILCELAQFEGFDVFVTGQELHFQPKPQDSGDRYAIVWTPPTGNAGFASLNGIDLNFHRSLTIAKGVVVKVNSWHGKHAQRYAVTWPKSTQPAKPGQSGSAGPIVYQRAVANKTTDEATQIARKLYAEITQHMVKLSAEMPGDGLLSCATIVQVRGTGTGWDQDYYPDAVRRSMSLDEGYRMTLSAKNISSEFDGTI
jgi:phage protein D